MVVISSYGISLSSVRVEGRQLNVLRRCRKLYDIWRTVASKETEGYTTYRGVNGSFCVGIYP